MEAQTSTQAGMMECHYSCPSGRSCKEIVPFCTEGGGRVRFCGGGKWCWPNEIE